MHDASLTRRTAAGLTWTGLSVVAHALLSLLILAVLSRLVAPEAFGLLAVALTCVMLADALAARTIGAAIVRLPTLTDRHVGAAIALSTAAGVILATAFWALAPRLGPFLGDPEAPSVLRALSAVFVIAGLATVPQALLRRRLRFRELAAADLLSQALGYGLVAIAMALLGFGVWALVWGTVMRHGVHALAVFASRPGLGAPALAGREAGELLRTGAGFSCLAFFAAVAARGSHLIIAGWLGVAALGHYTRAAQLAYLSGAFGTVLGRVLIPAMAQRRQRTGGLRAVYLHGIEILWLLMLPACLAMAICAPEIVATVLGSPWDAAVPVLRILAPAAAFGICNALNAATAPALAALPSVMWRQGVGAGLLLAGVWAGSRWGLAGVATAVVGARAAAYLLGTQLSLSVLGLPWRRLLRCHAPGLWAGAWTAPALLATAALVREAGLPAPAALAAELLAGGAAAAAATWCAPRFAHLASVHWGLATLPFDDLGRPGRGLRFALARLAHRQGAR